MVRTIVRGIVRARIRIAISRLYRDSKRDFTLGVAIGRIFLPPTTDVLYGFTLVY